MSGYVDWITMYQYSLTYASSNTSLGVESEMIWGCQWDAMLRFILTGNEANHVTQNTNTKHTEVDMPYKTGGVDYVAEWVEEEIVEWDEYGDPCEWIEVEKYCEYNDIASNIYDLEGNVDDWTQEVEGEGYKVCRGGTPSYRMWEFSLLDGGPYVGSRLSIYIK